MGDPWSDSLSFTYDDYLRTYEQSLVTDMITKQATKHDAVNHPKHYTSHPSGVECIEVTQHYNFCVGNAIKYLWRAGLKQEGFSEPKQKQIEDLNKAVWYIRREIENLENNKYEQT